MAFRTIIIKNRCKLEYSLNYLVCRGEEEKRVLIDEIEILIIQNTLVSLTCALLSALVEKKVKVIFCDPYANPQFELMPYYNNYSTYKKIMSQVNFDEKIKSKLWARIVYEKILNQSRLLSKVDEEAANKLKGYLLEIEDGDISNREGHAAKVYFNALFGNNFFRGDISNPINKYLNYGYSIVVSAINREIKIMGYLTEIGIHHIGETNPFNLTYDFVEPLRSLIDSLVVNNQVTDDNYKDVCIQLLYRKVYFKKNQMLLENALHLYVQSLFSALTKGSMEEVQFIYYEL